MTIQPQLRYLVDTETIKHYEQHYSCHVRWSSRCAVRWFLGNCSQIAGLIRFKPVIDDSKTRVCKARWLLWLLRETAASLWPGKCDNLILLTSQLTGDNNRISNRTHSSVVRNGKNNSKAQKNNSRDANETRKLSSLWLYSHDKTIFTLQQSNLSRFGTPTELSGDVCCFDCYSVPWLLIVCSMVVRLPSIFCCSRCTCCRHQPPHREDHIPQPYNPIYYNRQQTYDNIL